MAEIIDYPGDFFVWFDETGIRYDIRFDIRFVAYPLFITVISVLKVL